MSTRIIVQVIKQESTLVSKEPTEHTSRVGDCVNVEYKEEWEQKEQVLFSREMVVKEDWDNSVGIMSTEQKREKTSDFISRLSNFLSGSIPEENVLEYIRGVKGQCIAEVREAREEILSRLSKYKALISRKLTPKKAGRKTK